LGLPGDREIQGTALQSHPIPGAADGSADTGSEMVVKVEAGALLAKPADAIRLEAVLAAITADNQHTETDWGEVSGVEAW
jgi:hypothetical protein